MLPQLLATPKKTEQGSDRCIMSKTHNSIYKKNAVCIHHKPMPYSALTVWYYVMFLHIYLNISWFHHMIQRKANHENKSSHPWDSSCSSAPANRPCRDLLQPLLPRRSVLPEFGRDQHLERCKGLRVEGIVSLETYNSEENITNLGVLLCHSNFCMMLGIILPHQSIADRQMCEALRNSKPSKTNIGEDFAIYMKKWHKLPYAMGCSSLAFLAK